MWWWCCFVSTFQHKLEIATVCVCARKTTTVHVLVGRGREKHQMPVKRAESCLFWLLSQLVFKVTQFYWAQSVLTCCF